MDIFIFYFLILLVILLFLIGIIYLSYWIPKKMGKRKLGIILSIFLSIGLLVLVSSFFFEDDLYSKSDAEKSLAKRKIELKDDFKILKNESGGLRDYYHKFELEISKSDKNRLIDKIISESNYIDKIQNNFYLPEKAKNRYKGDTITGKLSNGLGI